MRHTLWRRLALAFTIPLVLAACGGGTGPEAPAANPLLARIGNGTPQQRSLAAPTEPRARAAAAPTATAAATTTITVAQLFDWVQGVYPELFPVGPQNVTIPYEGVVYTIRYYPTTNNYLGVTGDGSIFGLGTFTGFQLVAFGNIADYVGQVCAAKPEICNPTNPPPAGALNECADPAYATLPTGYKVELTYQVSGTATGEQSAVTTIDGPDNFEGQSAVKVASVVTGSTTVAGFTVPTEARVDSFEVPNGAGLWKTLGTNARVSTGGFTVGGVTVPGSTTRSKTVYNPPLDEVQFTLQLGQSATQTTNATTTVIEPAQSPVTASFSTTYTFVAKEPKTVLGRTFQTCRYTSTSAGSTTTSWVLIGKGVVVRSETPSDGGTEVLELKTGKVNGQPI